MDDGLITIDFNQAFADVICSMGTSGDVMNIRTGLRNATLSVYDIQGRKVHQQIITDEVTSIDTSKWENGTYVWELRAGNGNGSGNENGILESGKWVK